MTRLVLLHSLVVLGLFACGNETDNGQMGPLNDAGVDAMAAQTDAAQDAAVEDAEPVDAMVNPSSNTVRIETSMGAFVIELDVEAAPNTAANFLAYVDSGFYDGTDEMGATIFHRIISGFMVQGGGILTNGQRKTTRAPIAHESPNGLNNLRGTVAMARTNDPNSASSQFFVNHVDNGFLNYASPQEPGYVVFGRVIEGMDVIDAMASVRTDGSDVPLSTILIESATRR